MSKKQCNVLLLSADRLKEKLAEILRIGINTMSIFERYLTLWVFLCIIVGVVLGQLPRTVSLAG